MFPIILNSCWYGPNLHITHEFTIVTSQRVSDTSGAMVWRQCIERHQWSYGVVTVYRETPVELWCGDSVQRDTSGTMVW